MLGAAERTVNLVITCTELPSEGRTLVMDVSWLTRGGNLIGDDA
jgi:hypothetical protein